MQKYILKIVFLLLITANVRAQEWVVPDDKKARLSTFPFNDETRKAGDRLFTINCMSCHGSPGKGNYLNLVPPPGDPASADFQKNKDGEIFYKVSTGRQQMPSFRSVLSTEEIWNIVSYIRSFNSSYKQELMKIITSSAYPGAMIRMELEFNKADNSIAVRASALKDNKSEPVTGASVKLFVHRTFGHLQIDEEKSTNKDGIAVFSLPQNIPGDTAGNLLFIAGFSDEELFGSEGKDSVINAASMFKPESLVAKRAMWNNVRKAPVWIILTFSLGVLLVWGFIMIVLLKLRDIYIVGQTAGNIRQVKESQIP